MGDASVVPLLIKWKKESIGPIDLHITAGSDGVAKLKQELNEKTGVPVDRMKLMAKSKGLWKGVLKDTDDLSKIDFQAALAKSNPLQALLMGSAEKLTGPKVKTVFVEDLPEEEIAKVTREPSGLVNLGNTCYLNSVLQCLRPIPFLRSALDGYPYATNTNSTNPPMQPSFGGAAIRPNQPHPLLASLRDLYSKLDRTTTAVPPAHTVMATKSTFPQFAQTGQRGEPMQQDAEEFYSSLLTVIAEGMSGKPAIERAFKANSSGSPKDGWQPPERPPPGDDELMGASNVVDATFGLKMEETLTCDEFTGAAAEDEKAEPPVVRYDLHRKLVCNIQGGGEQALAASADGASASSAPPVNINHIYEGINLSLHGKIEKRSEVLDRNAIWTRTQRIDRLPPVLVVQFGRFYWKPTPNSEDHQGVKCKVMKPVAFQSTLDVYEFCSDRIKKILGVHRKKFADAEEDRIAKKLRQGMEDGKEGKEEKDGAEPMDTSDGDKKEEPAKAEGTETADEEMTPADDEEAAALQAALKLSMEDPEQPPVGPGLPSNFRGLYELFAVVTHKGRDADGGHYMGWVKAADNGSKSNFKAEASTNPIMKKKKTSNEDEDNEDWFVFDDDEVSPCKTEDVLKLKGGGDWHMSYLNFYRAKEEPDMTTLDQAEEDKS